MNTPLGPDQLEEIRTVLSSEGKIAAIKLYRELSGSSLREAKQRVEGIGGDASSDAVGAGNDLDPVVMDVILDLIEQGKKLDACRSYKTATGVSLKESKEFIERLMAELQIDDEATHGSGCAGAVLLIVMTSCVVGGLLLT